jgi:hypothetical protein
MNKRNATTDINIVNSIAIFDNANIAATTYSDSIVMFLTVSEIFVLK